MNWLKRNRHWWQVVLPAVLIVGAWAAGTWWGATVVRHAGMIAAALLAGVPIAFEAWHRLRYKQFSIPLLITVASIGALWIGEYWEAAAVTFLYQFGTYLESLTLNRTRAALKDLLDMRPLMARVKRGEDGWEEVAADRVEKGDIVIVRPGDKVPVDGTVLVGHAALDTAALTGEPLPKETTVGDRVLSGSISQGGYIEVQAEQVAGHTTFDRLIQLVAQAQSDKPKVQRFLDRFAQVYTPLVILAAIVLYVWSADIYLALTFLVIGCPGALVVAAPVAVVAGLGHAARMGILIKGGERLEQVGRIDTMAFDKTGTLTKGKPQVSTVVAFEGDEHHVLTLAATAETRSEHHLATAILNHAAEREVSALPLTDWHFHPGLGIEAHTEDHHILVGNRRFLEQGGVLFEAHHDEATEARLQEGEALAFIADNGRLVGLVGIRDPLRPEAHGLVAALRRAGVRHTAMLTGDNEAAAQRVADIVGIEHVRAGLLPEEKVDALQQFQQQGRVVAMIGDGVNDAPALATADVSIAMGASGTQVAMESADIVLVGDRLEMVPRAIHLSRRILSVVKQNVVIAVVTVLLLLAGVITRHVGLTIGMLVHEGSILLVILNGMRLLRAQNLEAAAASTSTEGKPVPVKV